MIDFTFLTKEQTNGYNKLEILKKYGTRCTITDFARLLGGYISNEYYSIDENSMSEKSGYWWTKTYYGDNQFVAIDVNGILDSNYDSVRMNGARPVFDYLFSKKLEDFFEKEGKLLNEILE